MHRLGGLRNNAALRERLTQRGRAALTVGRHARCCGGRRGALLCCKRLAAALHVNGVGVHAEDLRLVMAAREHFRHVVRRSQQSNFVGWPADTAQYARDGV